jgi:hypothetical protein
MYSLERSYGKRTWDVWNKDKPDDLDSTQTTPREADSALWKVNSFRELLEAVSFLGAMNKRMTLFYRGQRVNRNPVPTLFRDSWQIFDSDEFITDLPEKRLQYWFALAEIGQRVYEICVERELGLPRWRGLRDVREIQWAVIQHYELWPTPLLDITGNLRIAASFALYNVSGTTADPKHGFLFVAGLPFSSGSISFDIDERIVLARLQSACPPIAKRPHYQEGYLVGRFPAHEPDEEFIKKSTLRQRLIAKFELCDTGTFWDKDFPKIGPQALMPEADLVRDRFLEEFGKKGRNSVYLRAKGITGIC